MNGENYFRIKLAYKGYDDNGGIVPVKEEHLALCVSYGDAENVAYALMEQVDKFGEEYDYEVIKTKIEEVAFNDTFEVDEEPLRGLVTYYFREDDTTETGLYAVSLVYYDTDEKTGKEKKQSGTIFIPAATSQDAIKNVTEYLHKMGEQRDFLIRNVKYDKAQQVLVTPERHKSNTSEIL